MGRHSAIAKSLPKKAKPSSLYVFLALVLLLAVAGPIAYSIFTTSDTPKTPVFETYPSGKLETAVQALDREIYDALMALDIPAEDVTFAQVQTVQSGREQWTYSELTVQTRKAISPTAKKSVFVERLGEMTPRPDLRFRVQSNHKTLIDISLGGHRTHRVVFVPFVERPTPIPRKADRPRVAIIIDDMGYDLDVARRFLEMDAGFSVSILPHSPFQVEIATLAHNSDREVLLHLPMEPLEYPAVDPGPGALITSMSPNELLAELKRDLDAVPYISGVNNHMGSRLTEDAARMRQVFTILKKRRLFYVDSLTSPNSQCARVARLFRLPFAERQVFLDHTQEANAVRFQIKRLLSIARKHGQAVGIAHPYPVTFEILNEQLPHMRREVSIVPVSRLTTS